VAEAFGIERTVSVFEIDVAELAGDTRVPLYRDVTTYPPVRQDIAVVVNDATTAAMVIGVIREAAGNLLAHAEVFDVYQGPQVGEGQKSLAVHLVFQAPDRTLTDAEADAARGRIVDALERRLGASLRT
jgi:phenylalanyl-tRNA synthetase beta chain